MCVMQSETFIYIHRGKRHKPPTHVERYFVLNLKLKRVTLIITSEGR